MQPFRARSFRTALLATALTTAVAVPAVAGPSARTTRTIGAERAPTLGDFDFSYRRRTGGRRHRGEAVGRILWSNWQVRSRGELFDAGLGRTYVGLLLVEAGGLVRGTFASGRVAATGLRARGRHLG